MLTGGIGTRFDLLGFGRDDCLSGNGGTCGTGIKPGQDVGDWMSFFFPGDGMCGVASQ